MYWPFAIERAWYSDCREGTYVQSSQEVTTPATSFMLVYPWQMYNDKASKRMKAIISLVMLAKSIDTYSCAWRPKFASVASCREVSTDVSDVHLVGISMIQCLIPRKPSSKRAEVVSENLSG